MESGGRENITEILNTFITITSLLSNGNMPDRTSGS